MAILKVDILLVYLFWLNSYSFEPELRFVSNTFWTKIQTSSHSVAAKLIRLQKMILFGDTVLKEKEKNL